MQATSSPSSMSMESRSRGVWLRCPALGVGPNDESAELGPCWSTRPARSPACVRAPRLPALAGDNSLMTWDTWVCNACGGKGMLASKKLRHVPSS